MLPKRDDVYRTLQSRYGDHFLGDNLVMAMGRPGSTLECHQPKLVSEMATFAIHDIAGASR